MNRLMVFGGMIAAYSANHLKYTDSVDECHAILMLNQLVHKQHFLPHNGLHVTRSIL